jgi:hypothetical protein
MCSGFYKIPHGGEECVDDSILYRININTKVRYSGLIQITDRLLGHGLTGCYLCGVRNNAGDITIGQPML